LTDSDLGYRGIDKTSFAKQLWLIAAATITDLGGKPWAMRK